MCQEQFQCISKDGVAENCSSVTAPALPYYRPSMDICIFRTSHVRVGRMLNVSGTISAYLHGWRWSG